MTDGFGRFTQIFQPQESLLDEQGMPVQTGLMGMNPTLLGLATGLLEAGAPTVGAPTPVSAGLSRGLTNAMAFQQAANQQAMQAAQLGMARTAAERDREQQKIENELNRRRVAATEGQLGVSRATEARKAQEARQGGFTGSNMDAQSVNIMNDVIARAQAGEQLSPEDIRNYNFARAHLARPRTTVDPNTLQATTITQDVSMFPTSPVASGEPQMVAGQPAPGATAQALPGGTVTTTGPQQAKPLSAEASGRLALVGSGLRGVDAIESMIFNPDGSLNRGMLLTQDIPLLGPLPFSGDAQKLFQFGHQMTSARLRVETGAQAPEEEVRSNMRAFMPGPADTPESARAKLDEMRKFFSDTRSAIDPQGLYGGGATPPPGRPAPPVTPVQEAPLPQQTAPPPRSQAQAGSFEDFGGVRVPINKDGYHRPRTQRQYDALPSGTFYIDVGDGQLHRKP